MEDGTVLDLEPREGVTVHDGEPFGRGEGWRLKRPIADVEAACSACLPPASLGTPRPIDV